MQESFLTILFCNAYIINILLSGVLGYHQVSIKYKCRPSNFLYDKSNHWLLKVDLMRQRLKINDRSHLNQAKFFFAIFTLKIILYDFSFKLMTQDALTK